MRVARVWIVSLATVLFAFDQAHAERRFAIENEVLLARPPVNDPDFFAHYAWSPDGTKLIVQHAVESLTGDVWLVDLAVPFTSDRLGANEAAVKILDATTHQPALNPVVGGTLGVTFSPDGEWLLFPSWFLDPAQQVASISRARISDPTQVEHGILTASDFGAPSNFSVVYPEISIGSDGTVRWIVLVTAAGNYFGIFLLGATPEGLPVFPATRLTGPDPGDPLFVPVGFPSPSGDELGAVLVDDYCTDFDVAIFDGIQDIVSGATSPIVSRSDPRVFLVGPDDKIQTAPSWSSDGSLLYFTIDLNATVDNCEPGGASPGTGLWVSSYEIAVAETAEVLAGNQGFSVVPKEGAQFGAAASPGGTRFAMVRQGQQLIAATWRITDDVAVNGSGNTLSDFTLEDAAGTTLFVASGTTVGSPVRACRGCDTAAEGQASCTNSCFTRDCDDVGRTLDLGFGGAGCSQHDGNLINCELAWHTSDDGAPMSCFYDGTVNECRRCDRAEQDAGNCTNACLECNDPSSLANQNYQTGPQGCRALDGNEATCNLSYELTAAGVPVSCYYTPESDRCRGCDADHQRILPENNGTICSNVCISNFGTPGAQCADATRTTWAGSFSDACRQHDDNETACDGAWHTTSSGLPAGCYLESTPDTLVVSAFTPLNPVAEAQLAATQGDVFALREFSTDGQTFAPAAELTITYTDAELGPAAGDEANLQLAKFNDITGQYDIPLMTTTHDLVNNRITVDLPSFSGYGVAAPTSCDPTPKSGCRTAAKSGLLLKQNGGDKDKLIWKWLMGQPTTQAEFGEPINSTDYAFCLYAGITPTAIASVQVSSHATRWRAISDKGYKYKDQGSSGVRKVLLKGSDQDKSKVLVKGKGQGLPDPALPIPSADFPVTAQWYRVGGDPPCFESVFQEADLKENTSTLFKAEAQN